MQRQDKTQEQGDNYNTGQEKRKEKQEKKERMVILRIPLISHDTYFE